MDVKELETLVLSLQNQVASITAWATSEIAKRDKKIAELENEIAGLKAENAELRAKLNANSQNSSKPPSSDGYKKPAPKSLRTSSGKKQGGQKGHKGHGFTMLSKPDYEVACLPTHCQACNQRNQCDFRVRNRRNVIDISIQLERTEYQQLEVCCPRRANELLVGEFPSAVTGSKQYGHKLRALGSALVTECAVSYDKASRILRDMTSCTLSAGTLVNFLKGCKENLKNPLEYIRQAVLGHAVVNFDETGLRVDGKLQYMHTASAPDATYQVVEERRGSEGMNKAGILPHYNGIAVTDCWSPYWLYANLAGHGVCCAHLLRECKGLQEVYPKSFFFNFFPWLLTTMLKVKKECMTDGKRELENEELDKFLTVFANTVAVGRVEHPPIGQEVQPKRGRIARGRANAFIERMARLSEAVCLFICNFSVPFDNNLAERDLRHAKVKQKVSGCFRTDEGAKLFAKLNSYISTAKKRGHTALLAFECLFQDKPMLALEGATE